MPSYFKALATITVWVLFIWGCVTILSATVGYYWNVGMGDYSPSIATLASWGVGAAELVLSVVVMILRKKME